MYSLAQIQAVRQNTVNPMTLRKFLGNETMGWKIAWFGPAFTPHILDGGSHAISDFAGIGLGFRDTNRWLAVLTNHLLPMSFYYGDGLGSFNSQARLITRLLAGLGISWLALPFVYQSQALNDKLKSASYGVVLEQIKNKDPRSVG